MGEFYLEKSAHVNNPGNEIPVEINLTKLRNLKPSPVEPILAQASRMAKDPAIVKPPKMDVPVIEGKKQPPRTHNLKARDLNVLTPRLPELFVSQGLWMERILGLTPPLPWL